MNEGDFAQNLFCAGTLPDRHFRFVMARNALVAAEIARRHSAGPQVSALLAETLLGAFFLAMHATKQESLTISVQLECGGPVHRIVAFATADGGLRAAPSRPHAAWEGSLYAGKGSGILSVHRWQGNNQRVYSSSVEMRDTALAQNFQEYIAKSDQVQSFLDIESVVGSRGLTRVSGYMFQAMPGATVRDIDAVLDLVKSRSPDELVSSLLPDQLSHESRTGLDVREKVHVLRTGQFFSYCNCSRQKMENMLFLLGREKVMELVLERGTVEVFCEFCKQRYELEAADVVTLFETERAPDNG